MTTSPTTAQTFNLKPFAIDATAPAITLTGIAQRTPKNQLTLVYDLCGEIDDILLSAPQPSSQRQWNLWETTCFECFIGIPHQPHYWEVNLSSNHNWNLFALSDYRQGMQEASSIVPIPVTTDSQVGHFTLAAEIDLEPLVQLEQAIELSLTAVIQDNQNNCTYWAVAHTAAEPDFHQRSSFIIQL